MATTHSLVRGSRVAARSLVLLAFASGAAQAQARRQQPASRQIVQASPQTAARPARPANVVGVRATVDGRDVVRAAREYLGVRYVLGGTTPKAFDCSGFVRYVFARYDIQLPRTAKQQAGVGVAPYPGDLRPGDLLFFYGGQGAQHIALYVGGDTIIHASSSAKRVKLDRMSVRGGRHGWFDKRLIAVRRLLPLEGTFYLPATTGPATIASALPPEEMRSLRGTPTVF